MSVVVLLQSLQTRKDRRIFFWLVFFGAEGVVAEREEADGARLICVERFGKDGPVRVIGSSEKLAEGCRGSFDLRV